MCRDVGIIDAHFARAMAFLLRFMESARRNKIRAILTPRGLAAALAWSGGLANCSVQLVDVNYDIVSQLGTTFSAAKTKLKPYFTRCNDVMFTIETNTEPLRKVADVIAAARARRVYRMTVFAYSGVEGGTLDISLGFSDDDTNVPAQVSVVQGQVRGNTDEDEDEHKDEDEDEHGDAQLENAP